VAEAEAVTAAVAEAASTAAGADRMVAEATTEVEHTVAEDLNAVAPGPGRDRTADRRTADDPMVPEVTVAAPAAQLAAVQAHPDRNPQMLVRRIFVPQSTMASGIPSAAPDRPREPVQERRTRT